MQCRAYDGLTLTAGCLLLLRHRVRDRSVSRLSAVIIWLGWSVPYGTFGGARTLVPMMICRLNGKSGDDDVHVQVPPVEIMSHILSSPP